MPSRVLSHRLTVIGVLLCLEVVALAAAYQFAFAFECLATEAEGACRLLRSLVARGIAVLAALAVFFWARPNAALLLARSAHPAARQALLLHLAGVATMFVPLLLARGRAPDTILALGAGPWLLGGLAAAAGAMLWLAPLGAWREWLRAERGVPFLIVATAALIPDLAESTQPLWDWSALAELTFAGVERSLRLLGAEAVSDPSRYVIGVNDFFVEIARQCSGVEGFALVIGFTLLYAYLFRDETRFPHYWLVVLPAGLALSWALNVVRIAALVLVGAHVSPELAVNGFHSYAGWLFFTLLALSLLLAVRSIPWLQARQAPAAAPPLGEDWTAARILPFVALMLASAATPVLSPQPELAYPLKVVAIAAALGVCQRAYRRIDPRPDPLAVGLGVLVGLAWIALLPPQGPEDAALAAALAGLGPVAFAVWAGARLLGSVLLVPIVEELFFRGYLLVRLDRGGPAWRLLAVAVSTGLFAALHGRLLAAGLAGLVFALLALWRGRLADPIGAHIAANLAVALWAVWRGEWGAL